jgi:hypothetical protein
MASISGFEQHNRKYCSSRRIATYRASVFKAYVGAYWKQCTAESDRYDDGNIQGPYPNPVTALRFWLDGLIEHEVIQLREAD